MPRLRPSPVAAWLLAPALLAVLACSARNRFLSGIPGLDTPLVVRSAVERGGVLDATLVADDLTVRTFVPDTPECRELLRAEAPVSFHPSGPAGEVRGDGRACDAVGIGSLALWRDKRGDPIGLSGTPVPREQASYRPVHSDESVVFLRGDFPLAGLLGWTGTADTIAVVPRVPACQDVFSRRAASMQYYPGGEPVLALVSGSGLCPIEGLVRPRDPMRETG